MEKWSVSCGVAIVAMAVSAMAARDEGREETGESPAVPAIKYVVASPRAYLSNAATYTSEIPRITEVEVVDPEDDSLGDLGMLTGQQEGDFLLPIEDKDIGN